MCCFVQTNGSEEGKSNHSIHCYTKELNMCVFICMNDHGNGLSHKLTVKSGRKKTYIIHTLLQIYVIQMEPYSENYIYRSPYIHSADKL